jgi:hypothetical protein
LIITFKNRPLPANYPPFRKWSLRILKTYKYLRHSFLIVCFDFPTASFLAVGFFLNPPPPSSALANISVNGTWRGILLMSRRVRTASKKFTKDNFCQDPTLYQRRVFVFPISLEFAAHHLPIRLYALFE